MALAVMLVRAPASAETYPDRLIKLVVGYPPGGPIDTTARILVQHLAPLLGQTVIVENRPGALAASAPVAPGDRKSVV